LGFVLIIRFKVIGRSVMPGGISGLAAGNKI
jgi:hypothetical protein